MTPESALAVALPSSPAIPPDMTDVERLVASRVRVKAEATGGPPLLVKGIATVVEAVADFSGVTELERLLMGRGWKKLPAKLTVGRQILAMALRAELPLPWQSIGDILLCDHSTALHSARL